MSDKHITVQIPAEEARILEYILIEVALTPVSPGETPDALPRRAARALERLQRRIYPSNSRHVCVVCHTRPVDPGAGFDTCDVCAAQI